MGTYRDGPTYRETTMASFLRGFAATNPGIVPDNVLRCVRETTDWADAIARENQNQRNREAERSAKIEAVLATDTELPKGTTRCDVRVYRGSRDFRGGPCSQSATHRRTWETKQFDHLELDGKTVEHVDGKDLVPGPWQIGLGFTKRELTDEEQARAQRIYRTEKHAINLCGTHRRKRGDYGMPF